MLDLEECYLNSVDPARFSFFQVETLLLYSGKFLENGFRHLMSSFLAYPREEMPHSTHTLATLLWGALAYAWFAAIELNDFVFQFIGICSTGAGIAKSLRI